MLTSSFRVHQLLPTELRSELIAFTSSEFANERVAKPKAGLFRRAIPLADLLVWQAVSLPFSVRKTKLIGLIGRSHLSAAQYQQRPTIRSIAVFSHTAANYGRQTVSSFLPKKRQ